MNKLLLILLTILLPLNAWAGIAGTTVTLQSADFDTTCNNGVIERQFKGVCPGSWNEGALSAPVASYGYQPAGTANTDDPALVHDFNSVLASSYQGQFNLGEQITYPHPEISSVPYYSAAYGPSEGGVGLDAAMAFSGPTSMFISGKGGAYNGAGGWNTENGGETDSIMEINIPTLINAADVNDRTGINTATVKQPWSSPFSRNGSLTSVSSRFHSIAGMYLDPVTGKLCLLGLVEYDAGSYTTENMLCYRDPTDLDQSVLDGYYRVGPTALDEPSGTSDAAYLASWMATVPTAWRAQLGGRVLFGGGKNGSIVSRHTVGPSLYGGTLDSLPTSGAVTVTRHMVFPEGNTTAMGAHYFSTRATAALAWWTYEMHNCDRDQMSARCDSEGTVVEANEIVPWINDWFNVASYGLQGFIIPNTRTYVVVGTIRGSEDGLGYKTNPAWMNGGQDGGSNYCGGTCRVTENDLNTILTANNPWEVFPYEHGNLDFLDQFQRQDGARSLMRNATFDLATGRLAVAMTARSGATGYEQADIVIFQNAGWSE